MTTGVGAVVTTGAEPLYCNTTIVVEAVALLPALSEATKESVCVPTSRACGTHENMPVAFTFANETLVPLNGSETK